MQHVIPVTKLSLAIVTRNLATSGLLTLQNIAKEANLPLPVDVQQLKSLQLPLTP